MQVVIPLWHLIGFYAMCVLHYRDTNIHIAQERKTDKYLHAQSNRTKIAIIKCIIEWAKGLFTIEPGLEEELKRGYVSFKKNSHFNKIMKKVRGVNFKSERSKIDYKHVDIVSYSGSLTEKLCRICNKYHILLVARSTDTIKKNCLNKVITNKFKEMHQDIFYQYSIVTLQKYLHPRKKGNIKKKTVNIKLLSETRTLKEVG